MRRILSAVLTLVLLLSLLPAVTVVPASAKEDLSLTWNYGTHYGTPNPNVKIRRYTVIPCKEGDIIQMDFPSDKWCIYVHFGDAQGDFGLEYLYNSDRPDAVVIKAINGRMPTELRLTAYYRSAPSTTLDDAFWSSFDVKISKSTVLTGDLLGTAQWKQGSYENPAATIRKHCQIPCTVGDTFRFDFTGDFWDLYILPGDENGAITLTNTYLSKDSTYTVKPVDGKDPTNLILVAVPGVSMNINDQIWQSFGISCVKESNMITVATQNYGLWYNGVTQGVEAANVETAAAGWQKMITDHGIDSLCGQEWLPHFDRDKTIDANNKVFGKLFEYQYGNNTSTYDGKNILSKTPLTDIEYVTHPRSGRKYAKAYTMVNGKKVCIINAHLSFEEDINVNRKTEIMELLAAAKGEKYVIIAGDFNVFESSEFQIFTEAGYSLANAGAFGEFNTWPNFGINAGADVNRCLDNIIVSSNIIIRDAFVDYRQLSDHAMVVAKLELLDEESVDDRVLCEHCNQLVSWKPWTATDGGAATAVQDNGHYYLTTDLPATTGALRIGVSGGATPNVVLDLRGHTIHSSVTRAFYIYRGSTLTIMDSVGEGEVSTSYTGTGAVVYVEGTGELILHSGTIRATDTTTAKTGGAIYAETDASVTIKGGSIYGSKASRGGAICAGNQNVVTITGGTIYGGEATGDGGGAIYIYNGMLNMSGGAIMGGKAANGGNIHANRVNLNLTGGSVIGGSATNGGNIFVTGCSTAGCLNLGACTITGGSATYGGRDICLTNTGKMKVLKTFAGECYIGVEADHLPSAVPGSALSTTWDSGEGVFPGQLYLENLPQMPSLCGMEGDTKLYIGAAALVQGSKKVWYADNAAAVAAYGQADYLLPAAGRLNLTGGTYTVDIAGKSLDITGSGKLVAFDSANDTYDATACGTITNAGNVELQTDVTAPNGNRYLAVTEAGKTSMHRLEMELSAVTLRTSSCGVYYKAKYHCDSVLAEKVSAYGVVLSVDTMPGSNFMEADNNAYTKLRPDENFGNGTIALSGSVVGIMKTSTPRKNAQRGQMPIYANAYLVIDGQTLVADNENTGKSVAAEDFSGVAYSLLDVMEAIDANWADYVAQGQADTVKEFYQTWAQYGMDVWADLLPNIAG